MPGESGVTVVTTLVCFLFCTRGCGRIVRPAFPAPSDLSEGKTFPAKLARRRGEIAKLWLRTMLFENVWFAHRKLKATAP
jgi:hypothetical protein